MISWFPFRSSSSRHTPPEAGFFTTDLEEATQLQLALGGYLLCSGGRFGVFSRAEALDAGLAEAYLETVPYVEPPSTPPPRFLAERTGMSWQALTISLPVSVALLWCAVVYNPWVPMNQGLSSKSPSGRTVAVSLRASGDWPPVIRKAPAPMQKLPEARADRDGDRVGSAHPGGSLGSRFGTPLQEREAGTIPLPDYSGMARLSDIELTPQVVAPTPSTIQIPRHFLPGPGLGRGKGTGVGDGVGSGQGRKQGWSRAEMARMVAATSPLPSEDYVIKSMGVPHHVGNLDLAGSLVVVRLLVDADGVPLFVEALSGPTLLREETVQGARQWRFALSPRAKGMAPVPIVVRFHWMTS